MPARTKKTGRSPEIHYQFRRRHARSQNGQFKAKVTELVFPDVLGSDREKLRGIGDPGMPADRLLEG